MFRTVPLSIIRSFSLYTQQWCMSYSLRAGSGRSCSSVPILLASCQQTCMTYTNAVCIVKNSWWWTEELSETCRVLFQKYIWEISASSWFCYKNLSRCTVTWTSDSSVWVSNMCSVWLGRGIPRILAKLLGNLSERCQMVEDFWGFHSTGRRAGVTEACIEFMSDSGQCPA